MFADMELWTEIRRRVLTREISKRAACRIYEIHWATLKKILAHVEPPGYRRSRPAADRRSSQFCRSSTRSSPKTQPPKKQRHTAHRIWQRLRDEHGFLGGYTSVKEAVRAWKAGRRKSSCRCRIRRARLRSTLATLTLIWPASELRSRCS